MEGSGEGRRRRQSEAEIEAIAYISETLRALERAPTETADFQIVALARAVDALELGDFETARTLATQSLVPPAHDAAALARARRLVQDIAVRHLHRRFLRIAAGGIHDPLGR